MKQPPQQQLRPKCYIGRRVWAVWNVRRLLSACRGDAGATYAPEQHFESNSVFFVAFTRIFRQSSRGGDWRRPRPEKCWQTARRTTALTTPNLGTTSTTLQSGLLVLPAVWQCVIYVSPFRFLLYFVLRITLADHDRLKLQGLRRAQSLSSTTASFRS